MTGFAEYGEYDATGLAELVRKGDVSREELLEEAISRTEAMNPKLNAVVLKHYDEARGTLREGDREGPFNGVPFLLKNYQVRLRGTVTDNGARLYDGSTADHDSTITERLKSAGLTIFGKTNTPELALTVTTEPQLYGASRNPWDLGRTTGGSSGGSAAAVAARIVPMAHATDGGGSIRIPAAACGLVGFKPTRARNPSGPDQGDSWSGLSEAHGVTRTVRDSASLLDATAGVERGGPYYAPPVARSFASELGRDPGRLRIAYSDLTPAGGPMSGEATAAVEAAARLCEALGHDVVEAAPDISVPEMNKAQATIIGGSTARALREFARQRGREIEADELERITWLIYQNGLKLSAADYAEALHTCHALGRALAAFHAQYDVFLCPTLGEPPVPLGTIDMMSEDVGSYLRGVSSFAPYTGLFNMTGQPSISLPLHWTPNGLPMGAMFSGRFGEDGTLLRLAKQLESAAPWDELRPPVCAG